MSIFKCKMCGGALEISNNETVVTCEYCGTQQTLPKLDDEKRANLYDRANHFRRNNEFDKAMGIYEQILNEDASDAEAYWSLVLCRYGIEYVEDPATHKRVPTVNRAQFTSVFDDDNYKSALAYADGYQKAIYEEEAKAINEIQKGILAISQKEEPFDVFICYKETDDSGRRTPDSVLANDLYHQLTKEGFKVFFSRITLEDKLGTAYEPYIFAALNSAKVMVVLGTKQAYFNAVWVKNEWSRYLALIKNGADKMLIPAYKDMDPYDLPEEFSHLQAQDMTKLGFMQDLIRGIKKVATTEEKENSSVKPQGTENANGSVKALLERGFIALEDAEWQKADGFFEQALNFDAKLAEAYLGKFMADHQVRRRDRIKNLTEVFEENRNFEKALRFGDKALQDELNGYVDFAFNRDYMAAKQEMNDAKTGEDYKAAAERFGSCRNYKDANELEKKCLEMAVEAKNFAVYNTALEMMEKATDCEDYEEVAEIFAELGDFRDAEVMVKKCKDCITEIAKDEILLLGKQNMAYKNKTGYSSAIELFKRIPGYKEVDELIAFCQQEIERIRKKHKKIVMITLPILSAIIAFVILLNTVIIPNGKYNDAIALMVTGKYNEAKVAFKALDGYKDSINKIEECNINIYGEEIWSEIKSVKVGETCKFGSYEQDNNIENGKEKIEWLVLEKQEGKMLVISKYALDCKFYNTSYTDVTWETCTLHKWLNNDFINTAFSKVEKAVIPTVTVDPHENPNPACDVNPGNATQDKVFLLSITEANKYFRSDIARQCKPTAYAVANGAWESDNGNCWWWLRSPGRSQFNAADVRYNGEVNEWGGGVCEDGYHVRDVSTAVRPAMWIDLKA